MTDLEDKAADFAQEINDLLGKVLVGPIPEIRSTRVDPAERYVVQPPLDMARARNDEKVRPERIPLRIAGEHLADLHMSIHLGLDHTGRYLKALRSDLSVHSVLDRNPLLRLEYRADMRTDPISHWQIHAERGALTHLLTHGQRKDGRRVSRPHDLSSLHFVTGGERFRPCLEDLLQVRRRSATHAGGHCITNSVK